MGERYSKATRTESGRGVPGEGAASPLSTSYVVWGALQALPAEIGAEYRPTNSWSYILSPPVGFFGQTKSCFCGK